MRKNLSYILVVQYINLLILGESVIQNIHHDTLIVHHIEGIDCRSDIALSPPVLNNFDAAYAPLNYSYQSAVLLHDFVDKLQISLLTCSVVVNVKAFQFKAYRLVLRSFDVSLSISLVIHLSILLKVV